MVSTSGAVIVVQPCFCVGCLGYWGLYKEQCFRPQIYDSPDHPALIGDPTLPLQFIVLPWFISYSSRFLSVISVVDNDHHRHHGDDQ